MPISHGVAHGRSVDECRTLPLMGYVLVSNRRTLLSPA